MDYRSFPEPYSPNVYFLCYTDACNKHDSKAELDKKVNLIIATSRPRQPTSSSPLSSNGSQPFPPGDKKTSALRPDSGWWTHPRLLCYPDLSSQIACRPTFNPAAHSFSEIFSKVVHPYDPNAFERLLTKHDLLSAYPLLAYQLHHGFPLGTFPIIQRNVIHPNPSFSPISVTAIYKYIDKEVAADRTSGSYSPVIRPFCVCACKLHFPMVLSLKEYNVDPI